MKTARHNAIVPCYNIMWNGTVGLAILALLFVSRWLNPERIYETYDFSAAVATFVGIQLGFLLISRLQLTDL